MARPTEPPRLFLPDGRSFPIRPGATSYAAADNSSRELRRWTPPTQSADLAILSERESVAGRAQDIARNDGYAESGIEGRVDNIVGSGLRLSSKPDWQYLGQSPEWADSWGRRVEMLWRAWADDPTCWLDVERKSNFGGLCNIAIRHVETDGDALAILRWKPSTGRYATRVQLVDPSRLTNPNFAMDDDRLRGGVEIDRDGAPVAYHFQSVHPRDVGLASIWAKWERLAAETPWGRPIVVHHYRKRRAGQHRGVSILAPVLKALKMMGLLKEHELQAHNINAMFSAYISSPFDAANLEQRMMDRDEWARYQSERKAFHAANPDRYQLNGARIPALLPGEELRFVSTDRNGDSLDAFARLILRMIAAGTGTTYEQLSQDWSQVNYSSARAAIIEVWRRLRAARAQFVMGFCAPIFMAWLEEAIDRGDIDLPTGAPDFYDPYARAAYSRAYWIGPGMGWVDPTKEAEAAQMRVDSGFSTLEIECAEQGLNYEDVIAQRAIEKKALAAAGLNPNPNVRASTQISVAAG